MASERRDPVSGELHSPKGEDPKYTGPTKIGKGLQDLIKKKKEEAEKEKPKPAPTPSPNAEASKGAVKRTLKKY